MGKPGEPGAKILLGGKGTAMRARVRPAIPGMLSRPHAQGAESAPAQVNRRAVLPTEATVPPGPLLPPKKPELDAVETTAEKPHFRLGREGRGRELDQAAELAVAAGAEVDWERKAPEAGPRQNVFEFFKRLWGQAGEEGPVRGAGMLVEGRASSRR